MTQLMVLDLESARSVQYEGLVGATIGALVLETSRAIPLSVLLKLPKLGGVTFQYTPISKSDLARMKAALPKVTFLTIP